MARIEDSIDYLLLNEGGYTVDHAGPTKYGVTIKSLSEYRQTEASQDDVKSLGIKEALEIIKALYWDKMHLDKVMNPVIATCLLDVGYNRGVSIAVKYAQKICCELVEPIECDGIMGPITLCVLNRIDPNSFIVALHGLVTKGYESIINTKPAYAMYRKGWIFRADRLLTLIKA